VVLFFVTARYRLPVLPVACFLAAGGLVGLFRTGLQHAAAGRRRPRAPRVAVALVALALAGVVTNLNPGHGAPAADPPAAPVPPLDGGWFGVSSELLDFEAQHNNMAARCLETGAVEEALQECQAGLRLHPSHPTLLYNLLRVWRARADADGIARTATELAGVDLRLAAAVSRQAPGAGRAVGDLVAEARGLLREALGAAPDFAPARRLLESLGERPDQALEALLVRGAEAAGRGELDTALTIFREAQERAPTDGRARYNQALVLTRTQHFVEAAGLLEGLLEEGFSAAATRSALATAYAGAERWDDAQVLVDQILAQQPGDALARATQAEIWIGRGHVVRAIELLDELLAANPRNVRARALRERCR
jgi:tetratricopeptide (TPR) repeat protein